MRARFAVVKKGGFGDARLLIVRLTVGYYAVYFVAMLYFKTLFRHHLPVGEIYHSWLAVKYCK